MSSARIGLRTRLPHLATGVFRRKTERLCGRRSSVEPGAAIHRHGSVDGPRQPQIQYLYLSVFGSEHVAGLKSE